MTDQGGNIHHMATDSFDDLKKKVIQAAGLVVVDFFAPWCGPCQSLGSLLPTIAKQNKNVNFIKVNVDECVQIANHFNVNSIPHISFLKGKDGEIEELATVIGLNVPAINQNISKWAK